MITLSLFLTIDNMETNHACAHGWLSSVRRIRVGSLSTEEREQSRRGVLGW